MLFGQQDIEPPTYEHANYLKSIFKGKNMEYLPEIHNPHLFPTMHCIISRQTASFNSLDIRGARNNSVNPESS